MQRRRSSVSPASPVARRPELTLGLRGAEHRLEEAGEALLELVAAEPADPAGAFVVLEDHACEPQHLEVVARRGLADGELDRVTGAGVQRGEGADDLEAPRVAEGGAGR